MKLVKWNGPFHLIANYDNAKSEKPCINNSVKIFARVRPSKVYLNFSVLRSGAESKLNSDAASKKTANKKYLSHVLIRGERVQVACVKFAQDVVTELQAEQIVLRLKELSRDFNLRHSVAFMYACVARGEDHYGKKNVESAAFRRHFPNTPLLGFFGNGEIGYEYPIQSQQSHDIVHGYTTFIALICFP